VQFNQKIVGPGEPVQITVKAAPGSTVALSAVDQGLQKYKDDLNMQMVLFRIYIVAFSLEKLKVIVVLKCFFTVPSL